MAKVFSAPFDFKDVHACEAAVLSCIDFRFRKQTMKFVNEYLGLIAYDILKFPGSAKVINERIDNEVVFEIVSLPFKLHHAKKIVIINHEDCGAYGGSGKFSNKEAEQKFHEEELRKAKGIINDKFPGKEVVLVYTRLDDKQESMKFIIVK